MNTSVVVTCVGEALVDIIERTGSPAAPEEHVGGSPANVALTLGRLGHSSHLLTCLGDDARGRRIADHLAASTVSLVPGSIGSGHTSTAKAMLDDSGAASYVFDLTWRLPDPLPALAPGTVCLHTGSIGAVLEPGGSQVVQCCRQLREQVTISYDPNLRPQIMGSPGAVRDHVEALVAAADIVKMSDEDAAWYEPGTDPEDLARRWQSMGPALVVVTRGGEGAVGFAAAGRAEIASLPVEVADTVGAGDTFSAGLIDAAAHAGLLGPDRREALHALPVAGAQALMRHAARLAAVTVSRPGADTPWHHEVYPTG